MIWTGGGRIVGGGKGRSPHRNRSITGGGVGNTERKENKFAVRRKEGTCAGAETTLKLRFPSPPLKCKKNKRGEQNKGAVGGGKSGKIKEEEP